MLKSSQLFRVGRSSQECQFGGEKNLHSFTIEPEIFSVLGGRMNDMNEW